jgi:hypothetical protein
MRITTGLSMLAILGAASPSAGQGGPDPQQIVTLMTDATGPDGGHGPCGLSRLVINAVINPADGTLSPFVIPPGQVLILTGGTWSSAGSISPGSSNALLISLVTATTDNSIVLGPAVLASAAGFAAGAFTLQPGIVIRPGASLCVSVQSDGTGVTAFPRLNGFLAKDR